MPEHAQNRRQTSCSTTGLEVIPVTLKTFDLNRAMTVSIFSRARPRSPVEIVTGAG